MRDELSCGPGRSTAHRVGPIQHVSRGAQGWQRSDQPYKIIGTNLVPLSVKGLRRGLFYAWSRRVREVTCPKCQLSGLGWPRWIAESLPVVLPDPSR